MNPYPILFNQSPDQLRRIGARGGRAHARNLAAGTGTLGVPQPRELRIQPGNGLRGSL